MDHLYVKTVFQPQELNDLKSPFDEASSQVWFDQSDGAKEAFAKYLIRHVSERCV
jgi:hypothetical protein